MFMSSTRSSKLSLNIFIFIVLSFCSTELVGFPYEFGDPYYGNGGANSYHGRGGHNRIGAGLVGGFPNGFFENFNPYMSGFDHKSFKEPKFDPQHLLKSSMDGMSYHQMEQTECINGKCKTVMEKQRKSKPKEVHTFEYEAPKHAGGPFSPYGGGDPHFRGPGFGSNGPDHHFGRFGFGPPPHHFNYHFVHPPPFGNAFSPVHYGDGKGKNLHDNRKNGGGGGSRTAKFGKSSRGFSGHLRYRPAHIFEGSTRPYYGLFDYSRYEDVFAGYYDYLQSLPKGGYFTPPYFPQYPSGNRVDVESYSNFSPRYKYRPQHYRPDRHNEQYDYSDGMGESHSSSTMVECHNGKCMTMHRTESSSTAKCDKGMCIVCIEKQCCYVEYKGAVKSSCGTTQCEICDAKGCSNIHEYNCGSRGGHAKQSHAKQANVASAVQKAVQSVAKAVQKVTV